MQFLISGSEGPAGRSLCRQLIARGVNVIGCDAKPSDGALTAPTADSPALIPFLRSTIAHFGIDVFVPTVQDELLAVSISEQLFDATVLISSPKAIGIAGDKWLTASTLSALGIAVPRTYPFGQVPDEFPVVVKPRISRGGRGVQVIESAVELNADNAGLITQAFAPGEEFCPQLFISPTTGATTCINLRKTELKQGRVGNAAQVERAEDEQVTRLAVQTAQALDLQGPVDMDIRYTADGTPVLLEVNARFGANSAHAPEILDAFLAEVSGACA